MEKFTNIIAESINELGLFDKNKQYIFTVIKPGFLPYAKQIIEKFEGKGWKVSKTAIKQLLLREANELYKVHKKESFYKDLCKYMSSGLSMAIIYVREKPFNESVFKRVDAIKKEIRETWGESDMRNVLHSSDSLEHMKAEMKVYFAPVG